MRHASTLGLSDTIEWDDTDRDVTAQGTVETTPLMFEDTGVLVVEASIDPEPAPPSDHFVVTFRRPAVTPPDPDTARTRPGLFARKQRASTVDDWPPAPRAPAVQSPQIRDRAFRRAAVYTIVNRDDTKN
jgi:hypothetical protein